jgi:hypothetical protein
VGVSISWVAIRGGERRDAIQRVGLIETARVVDRDRAKASAADLPSGWLLIYSRNLDFVTPQRLQALSIGGVALGCLVEEHVMFSGLRWFEDGREQWSVIHEGEQGAHNLAVAGDLPAQFPAIRERLFREQHDDEEDDDEEYDVDFIFELPIELGAALCGFRHDTIDEEQGGLVFTELKAPASGGLGALRSLFRRG